MKINELKEYIETGREIEFLYKDKHYSITYGEIDGVEVISFCEFYQESTEVYDFESLLLIKINNETLMEMITDISDQDIFISLKRKCGISG